MGHDHIPTKLALFGLPLLAWAGMVACAVDCGTINSLISNCSGYLVSGNPVPSLSTPCCDAVISIHNLGDNTSNRQRVCRCLTGLISTYHANVTSIADLPGLCGLDLGYTIGKVVCSSIH